MAQNRFSKIFFVAGIFLILNLSLPISFAATVSPSSLEFTIPAGSKLTKEFSLTLTNQSCNLTKTGAWISDWIYSLPNRIVSTGAMEIPKLPLTISVPENIPSGAYTGSISYCDASLAITVNVLGAEESFKRIMLTILGSTERGKSMNFDVRDINTYKWIDSDIFITLSDGTTLKVECTFLSCSYLVSPTEPGPIVIKVLPKDSAYLPVSKQVDLSGTIKSNDTAEIGGGKISVYGPTEVSLGENYQFLVVGQNKPLKLAGINIVGPEGYSFKGTTNEMGLVVDSSLKIFGTEIKPDKLGEYTMFVELQGFSPAEFRFKASLKACPHSCCVGGEYETKECQSGYECVDNTCKEIKKPKLSISCSKSTPYLFDTITCGAYKPDGGILAENFQGTFTYKGVDTATIFKVGEANFSLDKEGAFTITIPNVFDYEGATYMDTVVKKEFKIDWMVIMFPWGIIVICAIVAVLFLVSVIRKRRGPRGKGGYPSEDVLDAMEG